MAKKNLLRKNQHAQKNVRNKKRTNCSLWMKYYCKISDSNHLIAETPGLTWFYCWQQINMERQYQDIFYLVTRCKILQKKLPLEDNNF